MTHAFSNMMTGSDTSKWVPDVLDIWPAAADEINTVAGVMNSDNKDSTPKVHYEDSDLHEIMHGSKNKLEAPGMHSNENVHSDKVEREMCNNENVCSNKQDGSKDMGSDHNTYGNGPGKKHSSNGTLKASATNDVVLSAPEPTQQDAPTLQRDAGVGGELRDLSNDDNSRTIGSGASECVGPNEGSDTPIPSGNVAGWNLMLNETAPNATDDTPPVIPPRSTGVGAESTGVWDEGQNMHSKNAGVTDDGTSKGLSTNSDCHRSNQVKEWYAVGYDIVTRGETVPDTSLSISEPEAPNYSELIGAPDANGYNVGHTKTMGTMNGKMPGVPGKTTGVADTRAVPWNTFL
jgi:hypothetical protein